MYHTLSAAHPSSKAGVVVVVVVVVLVVEVVVVLTLKCCCHYLRNAICRETLNIGVCGLNMLSSKIGCSPRSCVCIDKPGM